MMGSAVTRPKAAHRTSGSTDLHDAALESSVHEFHKLKAMAEKAFAQIEDEDLFFRLNADQNSISVIVRHMAGNMRSRWTDFLATDGEKPDRHRDREFDEHRLPRYAIQQEWEAGWKCLFAALDELKPGDLTRTVVIRGEPMTALSAIQRQISHYAYHVGQILLLAKHVCGERWKYVTIPRGGH